MPEVSRFYGIVVRMHYNERERPHFHAWHGGKLAQIGIEDGKVVGELAKRALGLLEEWRLAHRAELLANWQRALAHEALLPIPPLE